MKKLLMIIVLSLMWSEYSFAKDEKEFFISCSAKGYHIMTYKNQKFPEQLLDEYKITIGKGDPDLMLSETGRRPKNIDLVNTNSKRAGVFYLYRNSFNPNISYSDKIIQFDNTVYLESGGESYTTITISLISGVYEIFYKDEINSNDKAQFSGLGKCNGLVPLLSYLENKSSSSSYLDYWWAVILIIAITFFIFTQSGKRLKQIRRK